MKILKFKKNKENNNKYINKMIINIIKIFKIQMKVNFKNKKNIWRIIFLNKIKKKKINFKQKA